MKKIIETMIKKDEEILHFGSEEQEFQVGHHCDSATYDGLGRNIDSLALLDINKGEKIRLHPITIFLRVQMQSKIYKL